MNFKSKLSDLLATLLLATEAQGVHAMRGLSNALRDLACQVESRRDAMIVECATNCDHCTRYFSIKVTVKHERDNGIPSICVPCFESEPWARIPAPRVSAHRSTFRYLTPSEFREVSDAY